MPFTFFLVAEKVDVVIEDTSSGFNYFSSFPLFICFLFTERFTMSFCRLKISEMDIDDVLLSTPEFHLPLAIVVKPPGGEERK